MTGKDGRNHGETVNRKTEKGSKGENDKLLWNRKRGKPERLERAKFQKQQLGIRIIN